MWYWEYNKVRFINLFFVPLRIREGAEPTMASLQAWRPWLRMMYNCQNSHGDEYTIDAVAKMLEIECDCIRNLNVNVSVQVRRQ